MTVGKELRGPLQAMITDGTGELIGFEVHGGDVWESLVGEAFLELPRLAETVSRHRGIANVCGREYVIDHLIAWIRRRRLRESAESSWTGDLLAALGRDVAEQVVLIPLAGVYLSDLEVVTIGPVILSYFTKESLDVIVSSYAVHPENMVRVRQRLAEYEGTVYARVTCRAEPTRAEEWAIRIVERVVDLIRLFDPAAFDVRARCPIGRIGQVFRTSSRTVFLDERSTLKNYSERNDDRVWREFGFDPARLAAIARSGIWSMADCLSKHQPSDLEKHAIEAISHFAHGVASNAPQDRLVHALVAVESLLLRDQNEPIQANLGRRIALLVAKDLATRRKTVRNFNTGYRLRSKFVHHGLRPGDPPEVNRLLFACWGAIEEVCRRTRSIETKEALLDGLDDEMLTAG